MIRKVHVRFGTLAIAFASALEAGVDVVGGQDLTWNVIAVAAAVVVQQFVELLDLGPVKTDSDGQS